MRRFNNLALIIFALSMFLNSQNGVNPHTSLFSVRGGGYEKPPFSYEYQYGSRNNTEPAPEYRSGREVNFYYAPKRPGTDNCYRWDRDNVRCD